MKQIQEDEIISKFLKSIGPWRDFVVIGGGFALFIYKFYLADPKLENLPVGTRDIDSLIPRKVPDISNVFFLLKSTIYRTITLKGTENDEVQYL